MRRNRLVHWAVTAAFALMLAGCGGGDDEEAAATAFPDRDIRLQVPFTPGGGYDYQARSFAGVLGSHLPGDVNVVVDNQPGAGGLQAVSQVWAEEPDGHTIVQVPIGGAMITQVLDPTAVEFDLAEFEWIGQYLVEARGLGVSTEAGIESWDDLVAINEERPVRFAGNGIGSGPTTTAELLAAATGLEIEFVDYEGSTEAITGGFARGEIDAMILNSPAFVPYLPDGDVELLMIFAEERVETFPDVPTATEAGAPQEAMDALGLYPGARGYAAPPGTPEEIVEILREAFWETMQDEEYITLATDPNADTLYSPAPGDDLQAQIPDMMSQVEENRELLSSIMGIG